MYHHDDTHSDDLGCSQNMSISCPTISFAITAVESVDHIQANELCKKCLHKNKKACPISKSEIASAIIVLSPFVYLKTCSELPEVP